MIDIRGGQVVHARRGQRADYRPIASTLCKGAEPAAVARALLARSGADLLYVADLDALTGGAPQWAVVAAILAACPGVGLWLDAGYAGLADWHAAAGALGSHAALVSPVFASESLRDRRTAEAVLAACADGILSLDSRAGLPLDPAGCWTRPELWPAHVIVMTLDRVGSEQGPDLDTLARLQALRPDVRFVGAGGVRDDADLARARAAGAWAWLVASALHDGRIRG